MIIHTVKEGESVYSIASEYGVSPIKLCENNGISEKDRLKEGNELLILIPTRTTNAKKGETLEKIARRFSVKEEELLAFNPELHGRKSVYDGQPITVKYGEAVFGSCCGNGYIYRGCRLERVRELLPFLNYVTDSSAAYIKGRLQNIFDDSASVELSRSSGKTVLLRIFCDRIEKEKESDFIKSISLLAKAKGYDGITLAVADKGVAEEFSKFILEVKRRLLEYDLILFTEGDLTKDISYTDYSDGCIVTYDKLHLEKIPSFKDGERYEIERFSKEHESNHAFLELNSFAYYDGEYTDKGNIPRILRRKNTEIKKDPSSLTVEATHKKNGRTRTLLYESLENIRARLELVSEFGFMGISFDIMRAITPELVLFRSMFKCPTYSVKR